MISLILLLATAPWALAQDVGQASEASLRESVYEVSLPVSFEDQGLGELLSRIRGETPLAVERESLLQLLQSQFQDPRLAAQFRSEARWIDYKKIAGLLRYDARDARWVISAQQSQRKARQLEALEDFERFYGDKALRPAPLGGAFNYRVEKAWGDERLGGDGFSTYFDNFINIHGVVLESKLNYLDDRSGTGWFRGDTRLVKDWQKSRVRLEVGDVYPQGFGFRPAQALGGARLARNFTLDPYRIPFPQGQGQFTLNTRSQVKTFVNGILIRDEFLPAGNYDLRNIPLVNGLNLVLVEVTDELGEKRVYDFRLPTSVGLLQEGDWNFSLEAGRPFLDQQFRRSYEAETVVSGFAQYGLTRSFTLGGHGLNREDYRLGGIELGWATNFGNLFLGAAQSQAEGRKGTAQGLTWQLQELGTRLFSSYTLALRHERFQNDFSSMKGLPTQGLEALTSANITVPLKELFTLSVGASRGELKDSALPDREGWDVTLNMRALRQLNLSFFLARNRDEFRRTTDVAYLFFTWTFESATHFVTGLHDFENRTNRLTAVRDNGNRLYSPRLTAAAEEGPTRDGGEFDAFVPTPFADLGARVQGVKFDDAPELQKRGVARFSQALVFAYDQGLSFGLSRPVPNSFVLFRPAETLKGQKIALRSTSPFTEGETGPLGEITFTNLLPYQFREIQLDPAGLDVGTALEQEKFVVYPAYRSAHLIRLNDKGSLTLQGQLIDRAGKPVALKVGELQGRVFFTGRDGEFTIEGVEAQNKKSVLKLEGFEEYSLKLKGLKRGLIDLGALTLEEEE